MKIISESWGFILLFENKKDMKQHLENLQGELEWAYKENIEEPLLYCIYEYEEDKKTSEDISEYLKKLKQQLKIT